MSEITKLLFKIFKINPSIFLLAIITAALPIAFSCTFFCTMVNIDDYQKDILKENNYFRQITINNVGDFEAYNDYSNRLIDVESINKVAINEIELDTWQIAKTSNNDLFLESDYNSGFEITGSSIFSSNGIIISRNLLANTEYITSNIIGEKLKVFSDQYNYVEYEITGIIEGKANSIFSNYLYPEIFVYSPTITEIDIITFEANSIDDVQEIVNEINSLVINYVKEITSFNMLILITSLSLLIIGIAMIIFGSTVFKVIFESIFYEKLPFLSIISAMGLKRKQFVYITVLYSTVFGLIIIFFSIICSLIINQAIYFFVDINALIGNSNNILNLNFLGVLITYIILAFVMFAMILKMLSVLLRKSVSEIYIK